MKPFSHFFIGILTLAATITYAQPQKAYNGEEIAHLVDKLSVAGSVLYIAAHPDDENTRLLAHLANEKKIRTAYISLTRGDGGQNLLGTEIGPLLGLIRSHELMAARKIDRAEQFFTRAYDFGYSKSAEETFNIWDREAVLEDFVYIIRYYKPDLLITRFATDGSGGHGHHTASAILAEDAFAAAGDPKRFPEQLKYVDIWQPQSLLYNNAARFRNPEADMSGNVALEVGQYNPLIGRSYGEIAGLSRSMHKSQGFGSANAKGDITEYFKPIAGNKPSKDIFEFTDISLKRLKGAEDFTKWVDSIQSKLQLSAPHRIVPFLLKAHAAAQNIKDPFWKKIKTKEIEELLLACTGLWLEICSTEPFSSYGDQLPLQLLAINRSDIPVRIESISVGNETFSKPIELTKNKPFSEKINVPLSNSVTIGGPYWLQSPPSNGIFTLQSISQLENPVDEAQIFANFQVVFDHLTVNFNRPILYKWTDPTQGEQFRITEIIPPIMINVPEPLLIFTDNTSKKVKLMLRAGKDEVSGEVSLQIPKGFTSQPIAHSFRIDKKNAEQLIEFIITPPNSWSNSEKIIIKGEAKVSGKSYHRGFKEIKYDHIPTQVLFPEAEINMVLLDFKGNKRSVGYIPGAGDEVMKGIEQMGYMVTELSADQIEKTDLSKYRTIVMGVRAFNTSERLVANLPLLHKYVQNGGNLIVQYNTNSWAGPLKTEFGPKPLKIGRGRVTDEQAVVNLEAEDPILAFPHKISDQDFKDWVQERGLYFASEWDQAYRTPLQIADPGEESQKGSLVILPYGKGNFIYTGLAFFRQIPAGVPGAFRLLSNLIEASNETP
jgi:LmbE family N-acetylglucosaminyl deacetylase